MTVSTPIAQDLAQARFTASFRLFVGRGRPYALDALAAATGIPPATLKSYQDGRATPGHGYLLTLIRALPVEFAAAVLEPAGISHLARLDDDAAGATSYALNATVTALCGSLGAALADGRFDHREEAALEPQVRALQCITAEWLARRGGGEGR